MEKPAPSGVKSVIGRLLSQSPLARDAATGCCVGFTDIAMVYPLAVLATRRECGIPFAKAIGQGNFWAGGATAGTLLVPYSICVESLSRAMQRLIGTSLGADTVQAHVAAAAATTVVVTFGLQPIEKQLVMAQLGQVKQRVAHSKGPTAVLNPLREIMAYGRERGVRPLYDGSVPLLLRELCYITAITVVTPGVTRWLHERFANEGGGGGGKAANRLLSAESVIGSMAVGGAAGMASAPFQTLSAMMKSEVYSGRGVGPVWAEIWKRGVLQGIHRLWYGAATRSARTGGACLLYTSYRSILGDLVDA